MKHRLMFYTTSPSGGGAERVWVVLASELARRGHDVTLVFDFDAEENRAFISPEVKVVMLGANHLGSLWKLLRLLRRNRTDLLVTAIGGSDVKGLIAGLASGRRMVVGSYHGYRANESRMFGAVHFWFAKLWTWMSAATVCVSDGLRRDVIETWGALPERCVRIYNPIAVIGADPSLDAATLAAREPIVMGVGRLVEVKGFLFLVRAFARMRERTAKLVILGQGPQRDAILVEAARLGVADRVILPGYVNAPWTWYARARCFALSSEVEAFGNVVVEALAHGLPVVATRCDGPLEILSDPGLGVVAPYGDEPAFAAALDAAIAHPGDPGPRMVRAADFSVAAAGDRYEALFERLLAPPTR